MGYYVGVNLSFSTNSLRRLQEACAKSWNEKYRLDKEEREDFDSSYTEMMLEQVRRDPDKYIHYGNKGDMFIWGGVWNYYSAEQEIPHLKRFLKTCWEYEGTPESIMFDFDQALLVVNPEQSEKSYMYQFSWDEENGKVDVVEQESHLNWNQF